jgi:hypothetical protein
MIYEALIDLYYPVNKVSEKRREQAQKLLDRPDRDTVVRDVWVQRLVIAQVFTMLPVFYPLIIPA